MTALQLGVDRSRQALLQAGLDGRATVQDLHRAIGLALAALDEAEANRLTELTSADLRGIAVPVDASPAERHPDSGR